MKLSKLTDIKTGTVSCDSLFPDLLKKIENFDIVFVKEYNENFFATSIVDVMKHLKSSCFLT